MVRFLGKRDRSEETIDEGALTEEPRSLRFRNLAEVYKTLIHRAVNIQFPTINDNHIEYLKPLGLIGVINLEGALEKLKNNDETMLRKLVNDLEEVVHIAEDKHHEFLKQLDEYKSSNTALATPHELAKAYSKSLQDLKEITVTLRVDLDQFLGEVMEENFSKMRL